ncbi:hypothetical protein GCM10027195_46030 [Comamonas sediminis]
MAAKQRTAQLILQRLNLLRQRRLLDAQALCGTRDMAAFGHRKKIPEMTQFHIFKKYAVDILEIFEIFRKPAKNRKAPANLPLVRQPGEEPHT